MCLVAPGGEENGLGHSMSSQGHVLGKEDKEQKNGKKSETE